MKFIEAQTKAQEEGHIPGSTDFHGRVFELCGSVDGSVETDIDLNDIADGEKFYEMHTNVRRPGDNIISGDEELFVAAKSKPSHGIEVL